MTHRVGELLEVVEELTSSLSARTHSAFDNADTKQPVEDQQDCGHGAVAVEMKTEAVEMKTEAVETEAVEMKTEDESSGADPVTIRLVEVQQHQHECLYFAFTIHTLCLVQCISIV